MPLPFSITSVCVSLKASLVKTILAVGDERAFICGLKLNTTVSDDSLGTIRPNPLMLAVVGETKSKTVSVPVTAVMAIFQSPVFLITISPVVRPPSRTLTRAGGGISITGATPLASSVVVWVPLSALLGKMMSVVAVPGFSGSNQNPISTKLPAVAVTGKAAGLASEYCGFVIVGVLTRSSSSPLFSIVTVWLPLVPTRTPMGTTSISRIPISGASPRPLNPTLTSGKARSPSLPKIVSVESVVPRRSGSNTRRKSAWLLPSISMDKG